MHSFLTSKLEGDEWSASRSVRLIPGKELWYSSEVPDRFWGPPSSLFNEHRSSYLGVKRTGREVKHSPLFSTQVENNGRDSTSPICLHAVDSETFVCVTSK